MAESKVNRENYIVIQGWMLTDLKLKGNELLIYACIYGFSQLDGQTFTGSLQYLADWTNSTKQGVLKCLKSLVKKELIVKKDNVINGVKFCEYHVTKFNTLLNKVQYPIKQSSIGGSEQSSPNNIDIDNLDNNLVDIKERNRQLIADLYNDTCVSYPSLQKITDKRKELIDTALENYTPDDLKEVFKKAEESSFLKGSNERGWKASFNWLVDVDNIAKVLEGNYENSKEAPKAKPFGNFTGRQYDYGAIERMIVNKNNPAPTAGNDEGIAARAEELRKKVCS